MSTVSTSSPPQPPADDPDPYRYGWRYVQIEHPDGRVEFDQVPLTLEDVLFPEFGDFIVQTRQHGSDLVYLKSVFQSRLSGDPHADVLSDTRVDWNLPGVRPLGPDIAVFAGLLEIRDWRTLDVAADGARPELVVEVTSPDTRKNDVEPKFDYYYRAGVPLYVIADARGDDENGRRLEIMAYRHTPDGYARIQPDARGWIWLDPVGVWLGVAVDPRTGCDRLACYDPQGRELGDYTAVSRALEEAEAARDRAEQQAETEARRAETETRRAETEARRAETEARRADAEAEARVRAEERIRELEDALRRGAGPPPPA
jgi:hypothetical protein